MMRCLAILFLVAVQARSAAIVITNAALPEPVSGAYSVVVNFRPGGTNTVADVNPPRFSWSYTPDPRDANNDQSYKVFDFQCSTQSNFATLDVDIQKTDVNFYNFLAPFTNSPVYWRVKYYTNNGAGSPILQATSATRSFTFTGATPKWDRSMLADTNYLATNAVHPYLMVKGLNFLSLSNHLKTNVMFNYTVFEFLADDTVRPLTNWPYGRPLQFDSPFAELTDTQWAERVGHVAMMRFINPANTNYTNAGFAVVALASNYLAQGYETADIVSAGGGIIPAIAIGYDQFHQFMSTAQRSNVLRALEARSDWIINGSDQWAVNNEGAYAHGSACGPIALNKAGHSHYVEDFSTSVLCALAGYQDGLEFGFTNMQKFLRIAMHYMIGVTYPYGFEGGMNQGRGYSAVTEFVASSFAKSHLQFDTTFRDVNFTKNPWWKRNAEWWVWMMPNRFKQAHEPWGDGGYGDFAPQPYDFRYIDLTRMSQSLLHYDYFTNLYDGTYPASVETSYAYDRASLYHFYAATPTNSYVSNTAAIFPEDGWAMVSSYSAHDADAFTNGIGMIFGARPRASEIGHSYQGDLNFQMWAYGSCITDSGAYGLTEYEHVSQAHYCLLVNGYGQMQPYTFPIEDFYASFIAFTNSGTFAYVAGTAAKSYPRQAFTVSGAEIPSGVISWNDAPLARLTNVTRHIAMPGKKYWAIYDEMGATTNFTYTHLWHILEPTAVVDTNLFRFHYSTTNFLSASRPAVTNWVVHIATNGLGMVNLTTNHGFGIYSNLFLPGEFGYGDNPPGPTVHNKIWTSNRTRATNWHFLTIVYPQKPGTDAPTITRIDDFTVAITNASDSVADVVFFGETDDAPADATHIIGLSQIQNDDFIGEDGPVHVPRTVTIRNMRLTNGRF